MEPEVVVRSVRRRRTQPTHPETPPPSTARTWLIYVALTAGMTGLMFDGYLSDRPQALPLPSLSQATDIRSTIWEANDSLLVEVAWELTLSEPEGVPETVRVRVIPQQPPDTVTSIQPGRELADTVHLPAPPPGQTANGLSCVAAQHGEQPLEEVCTPWQYVRPSATAMAAAVTTRIVIRPSGLQVDPDIGGRCAEWQRTNPSDSLWIVVNLVAVPECTGPNLKPTVAQFCAFAILPDGRRIKTSNSINNPYCEELFTEWIRELYS